MVISERLRLELLKRRAAGEKLYEIARTVNVRANELSGITTGSITIRRNDARLARLADYLGLSIEECLSESDQAAAS